MKCRYCSGGNFIDFVDLHTAPPSNAYVQKEMLSNPEIYYPLKVVVCKSCWLVQTEDYVKSDEIFTDSYAYYSSTSSSWLRHAQSYVKEISAKLNLSKGNLVIEIASNDGYLLQYFVGSGIRTLGIEPTISTANIAISKGVDTINSFFTNELASKLAASGEKADLIIGNNVYAHVPDINDFTKGISTLLSPHGTVTLEFPHLLNLIKFRQYDTIYHEHYSYLGLHTVKNIFEKHGLCVWDVQELTTHGGSLRVFGQHASNKRPIRSSVERVLAAESHAGLSNERVYLDAQGELLKIKLMFLEFLLNAKRHGKSVAAYGAAAKGNTLLNYCGVKADLISFVCDESAGKVGRYLPGSRIPIEKPDKLSNEPPDYLIILPWNISDEIIANLEHLRCKGTRFIRFTPYYEEL